MSITGIDERPTVAERYSSASESGNLKLSDIRQTDADILMAAAWSGDGIGASLLRLRGEFDSVRSQQRQAEANLRRGEQRAQALDMEAIKQRSDREASQTLRQQAKDERADALKAALTARALVLVQLKTLDATKQALGSLAVKQATVQRFMRSDAAVMKIAGRCLDLWLDPRCPSCEGRGFSGGYDGPQMLCRPCGGSSNRPMVGLGDEEQRFAKGLMALMDRAANAAEAGMRKRLEWGGA